MPSSRNQPYACGLDAAVDMIGGKWKALILWELHIEGRRFGELKRLVAGVSDKMLSRHLREMESDGILHRRSREGDSHWIEYSLTPFGQSLNTALLPLGLWGEDNMEKIVAARNR
jgi:DNA-binding HxlR family transcriptional regulator